MKNLKTFSKTAAFAFVLLISINVSAQIVLIDPENPGNSTYFEIPNELKNVVKPMEILVPNYQSIDLRNAYEEAVNYAVDFHIALSSKERPSHEDTEKYNTILSEASKDEKFKLIEPLIDRSSSYSEFLSRLENIKPQLVKMEGWLEYYLKLNLSVQSCQSELSTAEQKSGCLHSILTGAAAGGVIGSWVPGIGTGLGAFVGAYIAWWENC